MKLILIYKIWLFCPVLFLGVLTGNAQTKVQDTVTTWDMLAYDGARVLGGFKHAYTRPFYWGKKDFITAGAIILGTGVLYTFDEDSSDWFRGQENGVPGVIKEGGYYFGKPQFNYPINGGVYLLGLFTGNEKIRKTGVLLISASTVVGLLQTVSKNVVGRARPIADLGKASFMPFSSEAAYHSFPSGHTILSFTTAYAIGKQFKNPWIKGGFYTLGLISPISRLWNGAHWLTDVAVSVALSVVVVDSIDNYLNQTRDAKGFEKNRISWSFHLGPGTLGLRGNF